MTETAAATDLDAYCTEHQPRFVAELVEACRIPSISAQPDHAADVVRNAEHFARAALDEGFQRAELLPTDGHPAVYAERIVSALKWPSVHAPFDFDGWWNDVANAVSAVIPGRQ